MRCFGSGRRRGSGARPMKGARVPVPNRSPDSALGPAMRGLMRPGKDDRRRAEGGNAQTPAPTAARRAGGVVAGPRPRFRVRLFAPTEKAGMRFASESFTVACTISSPLLS